MREASPSRVRNIFICTGVVFCASSRMTKACDRVRPRMKASGATSISPVPSRLRELVGRQHVVERVEDRPQIGIDLVAQIAGQKPQPLAGLDRRPGQDDALDAAAHQQIDRGGYREIGLAGSGRPEPEDELILAQRFDVGRLAGRARRDAALAGAEGRVFAPEAEALVAELGLGEADRGLDSRQIDFLPAFEPLVELRQGEMGRLGRRCRTRDGEPIAARDQRDAELPLDAVEMLIALAVKQRKEQIVVEFQLSAPFDRDRRRPSQAAAPLIGAAGLGKPIRRGCWRSPRGSGPERSRRSGSAAAGDMNALQIGAAPDELPVVPARLFEEHRQDAADAGLVEVALLLRQQQLQGGEPLGLHRLAGPGPRPKPQGYPAAANI